MSSVLACLRRYPTRQRTAVASGYLFTAPRSSERSARPPPTRTPRFFGLNLPEFLARTLRRADIPSAPVARQGTNNETAMVNKRQKTEGAKKTATTTPKRITAAKPKAAARSAGAAPKAKPAKKKTAGVGDGTKAELLPEQKRTVDYREKAARMGGQMSVGRCSTTQNLSWGWWMRVTEDLGVRAIS